MRGGRDAVDVVVAGTFEEGGQLFVPEVADQGVGVIPRSPLARGKLTRPGTYQEEPCVPHAVGIAPGSLVRTE